MNKWVSDLVKADASKNYEFFAAVWDGPNKEIQTRRGPCWGGWNEIYFASDWEEVEQYLLRQMTKYLNNAEEGDIAWMQPHAGEWITAIEDEDLEEAIRLARLVNTTLAACLDDTTDLQFALVGGRTAAAYLVDESQDYFEFSESRIYWEEPHTGQAMDDSSPWEVLYPTIWEWKRQISCGKMPPYSPVRNEVKQWASRN